MKYKVLKSHNAKVDGVIVCRSVGDVFEADKINTILINLKAVEPLKEEPLKEEAVKPKKGA